MVIELMGRLIFLASPGDVTHERNLCREVVSEFNATRAYLDGATFLLRGWQQVPGGVGRPQGRINPMIDDCDLMVLVLGHHWGTEPAMGGPYSSGTEEEFFRCLELLADEGALMRDVLVLLKSLDPDRVRDPGPQLTQVMEFRDRLEASKQIQYASFDGDAKFKAELESALSNWSKPLSARSPLHITLPERRSVEPPRHSTVEQLLATARQHASAGLIMQAEAAFAHAIRDDDPEALTEFAQFSRRIGQLDRALELNKRLLSNATLLQARDAASIAFRVNSLAGMGVIHRKRGHLTESIDALREAIATARGSAQPIIPQLCYSLDNYGLTLMRVDQSQRALDAFRQSHELRTDLGSRTDLAQSAINLGRASLVLGEFGAAESHFREAIALQEPERNEHQWANAHCGLAETQLRRGETAEVDDALREALEANERVQNSDGISITRGLLARLALLGGDLAAAEKEAMACQAESLKSSSVTGSGTASLLFAQIASARDQHERAAELLDEARRAAERSHDPLLLKDISEFQAAGPPN